MVPGSRGKAVVRYSIMAAQPKIMSAVVESWRSSSLTQVRMASVSGSPSSSPVTSSGPHGAWVSNDLPMVKVGVRHCQSRALTSLMTVKPGDHLESPCCRDVLATATDHHGQLALVVDRVGDHRHHDRVARSRDRRPLFVEPVLPFGRLAAHFGHVRPVVHADGKNGRRVGHRRVPADPLDGMAGGAEPGRDTDPLEAIGSESQQSAHGGGKSRRRVAQVDDLVSFDQAGTDQAVGQGEAGQPHARSPRRAQLSCDL